jgi:hypothetical protein
MTQDFSQLPLVTPAQSARGFFVPLYWRGGFSPAVSIGVFGILGCVVRLAVGFAIMVGLHVLFRNDSGLFTSQASQGLVLCLIVLGSSDCAVAVWQTVGLWRSALGSNGVAFLGAVVSTGIILFTSLLVVINLWNSIAQIHANVCDVLTSCD